MLPPLGAGRPRPRPVTRLSAQERHTLAPPTYRQRTGALAPPSARTRAKPLSILERAGGTGERRWLPQNDYEAWEGREDAIQRASTYACGFKLANYGHDTRALQHYLGHK